MKSMIRFAVAFILVIVIFGGNLNNELYAEAKGFSGNSTIKVTQQDALKSEGEEPLETFNEDVEEATSDIGIMADYVTVSTKYGAPVSKGDVTLSKDLPIDTFKNYSSSVDVKYSQTHTVEYSSSWNAAVGVSLNIPLLNSAVDGQIGLTGQKKYSFSRTITLTLKPGQGISVKQRYRKYAVPTYKVTKYSASMGGHTTTTFVGTTYVYVPNGIAVYDY